MPRSLRCLLALAIGVLGLAMPAASGATAADDPVYSQGLQWGLDRIGAPAAWATATGVGTTIAVVDSGIDLGHEDLQGQIVGQTSCIGANGDPRDCRGSAQDDNGHGTHVSGIAAAATDNGVGIAGVAPGARLLAVRALANDCSGTGCTPSGTAGDVSAGIRWAVSRGADVVNLSLGGGALQAVGGCGFCAAIEEAWKAGTVVVVAAGNDAVLPSGFDDEPAVVVTATTRDDQLASYSSSSSGLLRKARWPVAAPGGEAETDPRDCGTGGTPKGVLSTYWPGDYACLAGTSMAAPHVSGALAVLLSTGLRPQAAIDRLLATATDLGPSGRDDRFGYGRIDLARAVAGRSTTSTSTPSNPPTTRGESITTSPPPSGTQPATTAAPTTTQAPGTTPGPVVTPDTSEAALFTPTRRAGSDDGGRRAPGWLLGLAVGLLLGAGAATARAAMAGGRAGVKRR